MRLAAAVLGYAAVIAVLLAVSRAGLLAAVAGVALWLALVDRRLERGLVALAVVVPAFLVAAWAFTRDGLVEDGQAYSDRVADGRWFALAFVVGAGRRLLACAPSSGYRPARGDAAAPGRCSSSASLVALVVGVGAVAAAGDPLESGDAVGQNPSRLGDVGLNKRGELWREAWRIFEDAPSPAPAPARSRSRASGTARTRSTRPSRTTCRSSSSRRPGSSGFAPLRGRRRGGRGRGRRRATTARRAGA